MPHVQIVKLWLKRPSIRSRTNRCRQRIEWQKCTWWNHRNGELNVFNVLLEARYDLQAALPRKDGQGWAQTIYIRDARAKNSLHPVLCVEMRVFEAF